MRLLVAIPTYNNPDYIKEILDTEFKKYHIRDMALCIADSSEGDGTKELIEEYQKEYDNLYYYRFPSDMPSNVKVYQLYQMTSDELACEYFWMRSDALRADPILLNALPYYMSQGYDMILTNYAGDWERGIWQTSDLQKFFQKYAWMCCLYGEAIVNVNSMLKDADWEYLTERYLRVDRLNYSHVCMYCERLLEIQEHTGKAKILIMDITKGLYWGTPKKTRSTWHKDIFLMWLVYWPNAIEALPDYYLNKIDAIRFWGKNEIYYTDRYLAELELQGILNWNVFLEYKECMEKYSGVPIERFCKAASGEYRDNLPDWPANSEEYQKLDAFAKQYKQIAIYGCGRKATRYYAHLKQKGHSIQCFIVSDDKMNENSAELFNHKVVCFSEFSLDCNTGMVLALSRQYQEEVYPQITERNFQDNTFAYPYRDYKGWGAETVYDELLKHGMIELDNPYMEDRSGL